MMLYTAGGLCVDLGSGTTDTVPNKWKGGKFMDAWGFLIT